MKDQDTTKDEDIQDEVALHLKAGHYENLQRMVTAVLMFLVKVIAQACNAG
jgi:hypothetical protein